MAYRGTFTVRERTYSALDRFGHRQLLHARGSKIPWEQAVAEGLVEAESVPPEAIEVILPRDVYRGSDGGRVLVHRAGAKVTLAEAQALGIGVSDEAEVAVPEPEKREAEKDPTPRTTAAKQSRVRTAEAPAPEV